MSQPVLAEVAETIGLGEALSVAPGEAKAGVRRRATVLADALEAALGALYLDGGLERARDFVRRAWDGAMSRQEEPPKDAKTRLQEWVQERGLACRITLWPRASGPPHAPEFVVTVAVGGFVGSGTAGSKRGGRAAARHRTCCGYSARDQSGQARAAASSPSSVRRTPASPRC